MQSAWSLQHLQKGYWWFLHHLILLPFLLLQPNCFILLPIAWRLRHIHRKIVCHLCWHRLDPWILWFLMIWLLLLQLILFLTIQWIHRHWDRILRILFWIRLLHWFHLIIRWGWLHRRWCWWLGRELGGRITISFYNLNLFL